MTAAVTQADIYTNIQGLAGMRNRAGYNDMESLQEVAGQFEAIFIQMMLKSMRDANLGEGIFDSEAGKTYQSMFDQQISIDLSKQGGIGLAEMMVRQLSKGMQDTDGATTSVDAVQPLTLPRFTPDVRQPVAAQPEITSQPQWAPASPEEFVSELWPHARDAAENLGVSPNVLVAQAALETGWGKSMISGTDGRNSFNLFGIKADAGWKGERVLNDTVEFRDGIMRKERASFRAYASPAESFNDYVDFIKSNPRYRDALQSVENNLEYTAALQKAGYATDPEYSNKINTIVNGELLRGALDGVKESG